MIESLEFRLNKTNPASKKRCRTCCLFSFVYGFLDFRCELTGDKIHNVSPHTVVCEMWQKNKKNE